MHFKRKGPKSTRAGCLLCKPYKRQGTCLVHRDKASDRRRREDIAGQLRDFLCEKA